jgi:HK97 family phage major capsid protein
MDEQLEQILIQKADMLAAELKASGGTLKPEQNRRFLRRIVEQPTLLNLIRTETMSSDTLVINRIGLGTQFLHAATANTELAENKRSKVTADKLEFPSSEVQGEILIPYEALEDNIEGDDFIQTVLDLAAGRAAIDLEKLLINGDTASNDTFLALQDGILKRLTANVVDAGASTLNASLCQNILLALPNKYRRERAGLRWILHPDDQERLIGSISARQTALGDGMLTGDAPLKLSKIIAEQAGYMPDGVALLGNPKNVVLGIRRKFTLESERLISRRMIRFVLTARVAIGIEDDEAMVKATGIDAA